MAQKIDVASWEQFSDEVQKIRSDGQPRISALLFRGQADARWELTTSLERRGRIDMPFFDYYKLISSFKPSIETITEKSWTIPTIQQVADLVKDYDKFSIAIGSDKSPGYAYMAYLRHHGFPSPLLDWSQSPYVAAYFAFSGAACAEFVSIYVLEHAQFSDGGAGLPRIRRFGPNLQVHRRHVLQQSEYTMCVLFDDEKQWKFARHDKALLDSQIIDGVQWNFKIIKFNIPATERTKVLKELDEHNLNAFALFRTEESLMKTLAIRNFV